MKRHPFNPIETLSIELRRPEVRAVLKNSLSMDDSQLNAIADGTGFVAIPELVQLMSACGIEIIRSDYLNALIVLAKVGTDQIRVSS